MIPPRQDTAGVSTEAWGYIAPFAVFVILLEVGKVARVTPQVAYPARVAAAGLVFWWCSRHLISWRPSRPWRSLLAGGAVFVIWIAPDLLWPGHRDFWLFRDPLTGALPRSAPGSLRTDIVFLLFRVGGSALLVPIVEELFWRAWLMRWLISPRFASVPLGSYAARAFWLTAILFGLEHGPYWDVGLAAGLAYNAWLVRTRNLADCILAHAATNACLAAYVLGAGAWSYWM